MGVDTAVYGSGRDARADRDADAAVLADRLVVVDWVRHRAANHVVRVACVSGGDVDVWQARFAAGGVALGTASLKGPLVFGLGS